MKIVAVKKKLYEIALVQAINKLFIAFVSSSGLKARHNISKNFM